MASGAAPRIWNKANATLFGVIGGVLLAGAYLRRHPASTVGPGYHTSDKAPSVASIKQAGDVTFARAAAAADAAAAKAKAAGKHAVESAEDMVARATTKGGGS